MKIKDMKGVGKRKKERTVLRCPQCGSDDITYELGLITGYKYFCKNCKYVGPLVIKDGGGLEEGAPQKTGPEPVFSAETTEGRLRRREGQGARKEDVQ